MAILNIDIPDNYRNQMNWVRANTGMTYKYQILAALRQVWGWDASMIPVDGRFKVEMDPNASEPQPLIKPNDPNAMMDANGVPQMRAHPDVVMQAIALRDNGYEAEKARGWAKIRFNQELRRRGVDTSIVPPIVPVPDDLDHEDQIPDLIKEVERRLEDGEIVATLTSADADLYKAPKKKRKAQLAVVEPAPVVDPTAPIEDIDPDAFTDEELERMAQGEDEA